MAENINKRPAKSILKTSTSIERPEQAKKAKEQRFDESNIMATLHPADKDYGHMKIEEPKTPYSGFADGDADLDAAGADELDASILAAKLAANINKPVPEYSSEEEDDDETPEERKIRLEFEDKRKKHYNEFQAIKLARKLMEEEEDDDEAECNEDVSKNSEARNEGVSEPPK